MTFQIVHHYLTIDDGGEIVVETETATAPDWDQIVVVIDRMLKFPGGRSGTTITLTVSLDGTARL